MRTPYKLKLQTGEVILWEGATGEQAATGYTESHPGTVVVAWSEERHGLFFGMQQIAEPPHF